MPNLVFTLKPSLFHALFPKWISRLCVGVLAAVPVFFLFRFLDSIDVVEVTTWRLVLALIVIALVYSGAHIKFEMIRLHRTFYKFYETHAVVERKIINARRHSVPYSQIIKITNDHRLWDRITKTANIVLHTAQEEKDFVLRSIKHPDLVEHRIYKLLKAKTFLGASKKSDAGDA